MRGKHVTEDREAGIFSHYPHGASSGQKCDGVTSNWVTILSCDTRKRTFIEPHCGLDTLARWDVAISTFNANSESDHKFCLIIITPGVISTS